MSPRRREVLSVGVAGLTLGMAGCLDDETPVDPSIGDVTSYQYDQQNTGYAPHAVGPQDDVEEVWSTEIEVGFCQPIVMDGILYIGSIDETLYALDAANGEELWAVTLPGIVRNSLVLVDGILYIVTANGHVSAIDIEERESIWTLELERRFWGAAPVVDQGILVLPSQGGNVYGIGVRDGSVDWTIETDAGVGVSLAVADGEGYLAEGDGTISVVDIVDGKRIHSTEVEGQIAGGTVLAPKDLVLTPREALDIDNDWPDELGATLFAHDRGTLEQQWSFPADGVMPSDPTVADDVVYQGVITSEYDRPNLYAIDLETGEERWRSVDGHGFDLVTPSVVTDSTIYAGTTDGLVSALDPQDGSERWRFETIANHAPPVVTDGYLFITARESIIALGEP